MHSFASEQSRQQQRKRSLRLSLLLLRPTARAKEKILQIAEGGNNAHPKTATAMKMQNSANELLVVVVIVGGNFYVKLGRQSNWIFSLVPSKANWKKVGQVWADVCCNVKFVLVNDLLLRDYIPEGSSSICYCRSFFPPLTSDMGEIASRFSLCRPPPPLSISDSDFFHPFSSIAAADFRVGISLLRRSGGIAEEYIWTLEDYYSLWSKVGEMCCRFILIYSNGHPDGGRGRIWWPVWSVAVEWGCSDRHRHRRHGRLTRD